MATINFLFRSTKEQAPLTLRLLFRNNNTDYVFGSNTKLIVTKEYWKKQHNNKRIKETDILTTRNKVNDQLGKIQEFILNAFNTTDANIVDKKWLENQIHLFYNPPTAPEQLPTDLINYLDKYIEFKKNDITYNTKKENKRY